MNRPGVLVSSIPQSTLLAAVFGAASGVAEVECFQSGGMTKPLPSQLGVC